jgi:phosphotransferase system enzyme I (PtsI)
MQIHNAERIRTAFHNAKVERGNVLPAHVIEISKILPIHTSALKGLEHASIKDFIKTEGMEKIGAMLTGEEILVFGAKSFEKANLEIRIIDILDEKNKTLSIKMLADKKAQIAGDSMPVIFEGMDRHVFLPKEIKVQMIINPPVDAPRPEFTLTGRTASDFIGIGRAFVSAHLNISKFPAEDIPADQVGREVEDAAKAFVAISGKYSSVQSKGGACAEITKPILNVLDAIGPVTLKLISEGHMNFKKALDTVFLPDIEKMCKEADEKFRTVGQELRKTYESLILTKNDEMPDLLAGVESVSNFHKGEKVILICDKIDFVEVASLDNKLVAGAVEEKGGVKSHTTIACKSNGIALAIGVDGATEKIMNGDMVIVDGDKGIVIVNPTRERLSEYTDKQKISNKVRADLRKKYLGKKPNLYNGPEVSFSDKYISKNPSLINGTEVSVLGNSMSIAETIRLENEKIEGVGLFRTERFMNVVTVDGTIVKRNKEPSWNEQVAFYSEIYKTMKGNVVFRTFDVNGDKFITYLGLPKKDPLFGSKEGIGLCLDRENHKPYFDLFKDQVKAILVAAKLNGVENPIIEFPVVKNVQEFIDAKEVVMGAIKEMREDKETIQIEFEPEFESKVRYYAMVEHPSLIRTDMDKIAKEADGLSIGASDLTKFTMFEDRYSATGKFDELHPVVLSLMAQTVAEAEKAKKHLLICGDMANDPLSVVVLLGLGIRHFSVDISSVHIINSMISNVDLKTCKKLIEELEDVRTAEEVRMHVARFIIHKRDYFKAKDSKERSSDGRELGDWSGLNELGDILNHYIDKAGGFTVDVPAKKE